MRLSPDLLERAQTLAHFGTWVCAVPAAGRFECSDEYRRILGLPADGDVTVEDFVALIHPDDRPRVGVARMGADPGASELRYRIVRPDGAVRWIHSTAVAEHDATGRAVRMMGVSHDVTEQHEATEALRASEERYRRIVEGTNEGIWMLDTEGRTTFVNQRMAAMLGLTPSEALGRSVLDFVDETLHPHVRRNLEQRRAGVASQHEMELRRRDGTRMVALLDSNPVFDEAGRYLGALAMVLDVTAPRAAEEERRQLEAALTSSQEQLQHAQKLEAVGLLAGGVAHDFNNLLSVILSYSDLIASGLDSADPLAQDVEEIRLAGERATHLTRQLLAFGRRQVLVPRVVDLNDVVAGVEKMLRRLIREDVAFATRRAERPVKVRVDVHQMEQVLMNLAVNARDAMPGGGSLVIETSEALIDDAFAARHGGLRPGPHACLSVRDTGFGMSQETMKRVFEPFFTTKESGRGTGLGLSVVHGIVQQSGGAVVVKSEPGVGTTFDVYLPALPCADVETEATRRVSDSVRMRGTETVLLVDDDESVRTVARRILERFGYRVLESQTVGDALLIAEREGTLDLLLTDVVMPLMDGRELAGRLRRMRPEMRVVYMSGYADGRIDARGDEHFAFVPKPLTPFGLACSVREVLDAN